MISDNRGYGRVISSSKLPYLLGKPFIIKTDHHSLKYLLEQRITTPSQKILLVKLMGYDYSISYKKGKENTVVDALSRRDEPAHLHSISGVVSELFKEVQHTWTTDSNLQKLISTLQTSTCSKPYYRYHAGMKGRSW